MEEKALQPGNTVPVAPDKRPDFTLADFKEGRVFEWLTGLKSGYQQAMEEQALAFIFVVSVGILFLWLSSFWFVEGIRSYFF